LFVCFGIEMAQVEKASWSVDEEVKYRFLNAEPGYLVGWSMKEGKDYAQVARIIKEQGVLGRFLWGVFLCKKRCPDHDYHGYREMRSPSYRQETFLSTSSANEVCLQGRLSRLGK